MFGVEKMLHSRQLPNMEAYYIGMLYLAAASCRDPESQHSALVTDNDNILKTPIICNYLVKPHYIYNKDWNKRDLQMITAEEAVIDHILKLNENLYFTSLQLFCSGKPSFNAIRRCSQVGLKKVFYGKLESEQFNVREWDNTKLLATEYDIQMKPYVGNVNWVRDKIQNYESLF